MPRPSRADGASRAHGIIGKFPLRMICAGFRAPGRRAGWRGRAVGLVGATTGCTRRKRCPSPGCQGAAQRCRFPNYPACAGLPGVTRRKDGGCRRVPVPLSPRTQASPLGEGTGRAWARAPGRASGVRRRAGAGGGPPLQTLTLFSQVRRQFPWKQPGAETGTRIQKCEASSSRSPSWIPAPRGPGMPAGRWLRGTHAAPTVSGCRAGSPGHPVGLGCSYALARCGTRARCTAYGDVSCSREGGPQAGGTAGRGDRRQGILQAAPCPGKFRQHLHTSVHLDGAEGWVGDVRVCVVMHGHTHCIGGYMAGA